MFKIKESEEKKVKNATVINEKILEYHLLLLQESSRRLP